MLASKLSAYLAPVRRANTGSLSHVEVVLQQAKDHLARLEALRKNFAAVCVLGWMLKRDCAVVDSMPVLNDRVVTVLHAWLCAYQ